MARIFNVVYEQRFSYDPNEWWETRTNVLTDDDNAQSAINAARQAALAEKGVLEAEDEREKDERWKCLGFRLVSVSLEAEADISTDDD